MPSRHSDYKEVVPAHILASRLDSQRHDIAIVGAGITGLGVTIGLCQSGHNVEVRLLHCIGLNLY